MVTRKVSEPVQDALKAYFELALGLTEASRKKAEKTVKKVAKELVGKGNATASQIQGAVEELVSTSAANREAVTRLVRVELDRAVSRMGLASNEDVTVLKNRIEALEGELRDRRANSGTNGMRLPSSAVEAPPKKAAAGANAAPAKKATVAKKAVVAKKAPVVKTSPTVKAADVPVAKKASGAPPAKKAGDGPAAKKAADGPAAKKAGEATPAKKAGDVPVAKKAVKKAAKKATEATP